MTQEGSRQRRSFITHQTFASTVPCPICGKKFGVEKVAEHADRCAARLEGEPLAEEHRMPNHLSVSYQASKRQHTRSSTLEPRNSAPKSSAEPKSQSETVTRKRKQKNCLSVWHEESNSTDADTETRASANVHCLLWPDNSTGEAEGTAHNAHEHGHSFVWTRRTVGNLAFRFKNLPTELQPSVVSFDDHMRRHGLAKASITSTPSLAHIMPNPAADPDPTPHPNPNTKPNPTKRRKTKHLVIGGHLSFINGADAHSTSNSSWSVSNKSSSKLLASCLDDITNQPPIQKSDIACDKSSEIENMSHNEVKGLELGSKLAAESSLVEINSCAVKSSQVNTTIGSAKANQKPESARSPSNILSHHASSTCARTQSLKTALPDYRNPPMTAAQMTATEQTMHKAKLLVDSVKEALKGEPCKLKEFYSIVLQSTAQFLFSMSSQAFQDTSINVLVAFQKLFEENDEIIDKLVDFMPSKHDRVHLHDRYPTLSYPLLPQLPQGVFLNRLRHSWPVNGQLLSANPNPKPNPKPNSKPNNNTNPNTNPYSISKPNLPYKHGEDMRSNIHTSNQPYGRQMVSRPYSDGYSASYHPPYPLTHSNTHTHTPVHIPNPYITPTSTYTPTQTRTHTPTLQSTYQLLLPLAAGIQHTHTRTHTRENRSDSGKC